MNIQYDKIYSILRVEGNILIFDFKEINFLNTFEIVELFALAVTFQFAGNSYKVINKTEAVDYLRRINFFPLFEQIKNIYSSKECNLYTGNNDGLIELHGYYHKEQFYSDYDKIFAMLKNIGLTDEATSLVASSLGEVVDNAFLHNFGRWSIDVNGRSILLSQNFPQKRELCFSYCDFGIGFLATLSANYPELNNNFEAIKLALEKNVTARSPQRGGNGLIYLQQNVFNGFKGELLLRSGEAFVSVKSKNNVILLNNDVRIGSGSNIFFSLKY